MAFTLAALPMVTGNFSSETHKTQLDFWSQDFFEESL